MSETRADVVVLGGGLAGLTLALQTKRQSPQANIVVLEKNTHPVPEATHKVGESTVEVGAYYFGKVLQLENHIRDHQLPKLGLRFFFGAGDNSRIEPRLELGGTRYAVTPSYQLDRGRFENYLAELCQQEGIKFVDGTTVKDIEMGRWWGDHKISYQRNGETTQLNTRWVADASGRAGFLKRKLNLKKESSHRANAVWFRVDERIRIDDWSQDENWQQGYEAEGDIARWYSTNHLMGEGYWVWLIPLASGSTSIGIVADERIHPLNTFNTEAKAFEWLEQHESQCAAKIQHHQDRWQDFLAVKNYSMECKQVFSSSRWGLVGEAGFFLDPFYSPGSDFIAMGNTMLSDLIVRDLAGKGIRFRSFVYDRIFKRFFSGTAHVYQDQYPLFGNHQIMPVKVIWDYLVYWSLTGHVVLHDKVCDIYAYPWHFTKLQKISNLNAYMQGYFRQWHESHGTSEVSGRVSVSEIPLIYEMNEKLSRSLSSREYSQAFSDNLAQVESVFWEIIDHVGLDVQVPFRRRQHPKVKQDVLKDVFRVTAPKPATDHNPMAEAV